MTKLSDDLLPILELELRCGNELERVDEPAGSSCPYAVVLRDPIHKATIEAELRLPPEVVYWECHDTHYEIQAGYYSKTSQHSIAGPIASQST